MDVWAGEIELEAGAGGGAVMTGGSGVLSTGAGLGAGAGGALSAWAAGDAAGAASATDVSLIGVNCLAGYLGAIGGGGT